MRINVTQVKIEMTMYYFNNIYIEGRKKSKKRSVERMKEREYISFTRDASYMGCKKPFISFTI